MFIQRVKIRAILLRKNAIGARTDLVIVAETTVAAVIVDSYCGIVIAITEVRWTLCLHK